MGRHLYYYNQHSAYLSDTSRNVPNVSYCKLENEVHYNPEIFASEYFTTVALESGIIYFTILSHADTSYITSFAYSKNNGEWVEVQNSDNREEEIVISVSVVEGDKIRWKGIANHIGDDGDNGGVFKSTCRFNAQGNIMSLLYGDNFNDKVTLEEDWSFSYLFSDINNGGILQIVNASNLIIPATTLAARCYDSMFYGCTSLTIPPKLPATTLAEGCYSQMFFNCTNLTTTPELPATTLTRVCYAGMFANCTNLTTVLELPATTLAEGCYQSMFYNCTNLTTVPELPATILADYCYEHMFMDCTSLNSITCLATNISANLCTQYWVRGVASSGTFIKADGANWTTGVDGIPTGWNVYIEDDLKVVKHYELDESELAISAALNELNSKVQILQSKYSDINSITFGATRISKGTYSTVNGLNVKVKGINLNRDSVMVYTPDENLKPDVFISWSYVSPNILAGTLPAPGEWQIYVNGIIWAVVNAELSYPDGE